MPNRNKQREGEASSSKGRGRKARGAPTSQEDMESDDSDLASEVSHLSLDDDMQSVMGEGPVEAESVPDDMAVMESQIDEALDKATHKNTSVRLAALKHLRLYLTSSVIPEAIDKFKETIVDVAIKAVKRGSSSEETCCGLSLLVLVTIQNLEAGDIIMQHLTLLRTMLTNEALSSTVRCHCAVALSICSVLVSDEIEDFRLSLESARSVWCAVKSGATTQEAVPLFCAALNCWALLLSKMPLSRQTQILNTDIPKLCQFLKSCQVEARTSAGEILSVLYEYGYNSNEEFRPSNHQQTIDTLSELATDSLKYRAKRDRRRQRATFREIYAAVKEGDGPDLKLKLSNDEEIVLTAWIDRLYYDALCVVLKGGINVHMQKNMTLRNIFELGPAIDPMVLAGQAVSKSMKRAMFSSIEKERHLVRGKQRNKRTEDISSF